MNCPEILPAGTIFRIEQNKFETISPSAVGLVCRITKDTQLKMFGSDSCYSAIGSEVLQNPNGWPHEMVTHSIDLNCDIILETVSNKLAKSILVRWEDKK